MTREEALSEMVEAFKKDHAETGRWFWEKVDIPPDYVLFGLADDPYKMPFDELKSIVLQAA